MVDIFLLILLGVGFISGLFSGAVKQIVSLAAFVVGFAIASHYYQMLGDVLESVLPYSVFCKVVAFVLLWVFIPIIARLAGSLLTSLLDALLVLGLLNRLLGGIIGAIKYALILGACIWLLSSLGMIKEEALQESKLCKPLKALPELLYKKIQKSPLPAFHADFKST